MKRLKLGLKLKFIPKKIIELDALLIQLRSCK